MYRVYEGRLFWQRRLSEILTLRLQKQIDDKLERANKLNKSSMEYKELWYWLRMFPLDDKGDPVAKRPTIVGNVMEGYEEYPLRRYGMDAIFYWYRLGPTLPESFATQLDRAWAEADGLMYVSFSGTIIGFLYLFISIIKWILLAVLYPGNSSMPTTPTLEYFISIPPVYILALLFPILLIGAYLVYRWSIPAHRTTGEYFKAAFDVYRKNISDIKKISPTEKEKWRKTWSYLQYMYVQCPHCKNFHFAEEEKCPYCGKSPVRWSVLQRLFKK